MKNNETNSEKVVAKELEDFKLIIDKFGTDWSKVDEC